MTGQFTTKCPVLPVVFTGFFALCEFCNFIQYQSPHLQGINEFIHFSPVGLSRGNPTEERNPGGLGVEKVETGMSGCQALDAPAREKRSRQVHSAESLRVLA